MKKVKITFLGTGDAVPTKLRNHTAILVTLDSENILIDCGEGTQRQFKTAKISPSKLTKILITHKHGDHTFGLPGLLRTLEMSNYSKTLEIYGPRGTKNLISQIKKFAGGEGPKISVHEVSSGKFIDEKDFQIEASPMRHGTPANAYSITLKQKLRLNKAKLRKLKLPSSPILKKLQEGKTISYKGKKIRPTDVAYKEKPKKITFVLDTKKNPNITRIAKNSDLLIIESTFSAKETATAHAYKHLTVKEAAQIAKKANVKSLIITHISQRYEKNLSKIEKEAKKIFKKTKLAKDFMSIEI